ncbi:MAG: SurA N-terminal domain-containing protein [Candidatus Omnitrophica bacterium]|nr:SurA N-terminal domain-containing protein [Candidatus Omnitrophota bacterium]
MKYFHDKKTQKKIWIFLALIIVPAFVLWGTGSVMRSQQSNRPVGRIAGKTVSLDDYKNALNATQTQMYLQFGDKYDELKKFFNLEAQAWDRLILLIEAKKRKLKADDKEVINFISSVPLFQRKGEFDSKIYNQMVLYSFRTSPRIFEEQIRQSLILGKLYKQITSEVKLNDQEIKEAYIKENEQISLYYLASLYSDSVKDINPTDTELQDYFQKNPAAFKQPLSLNASYFISDSETKSKTAYTRLKRNEPKETVAKDLNLTIKETGFFGLTDPIPGIGWEPEISSAISKMKPGDILPPVPVDKNFYIFILKDIKEPAIPEFPSVKNIVKEAFIKEKSKETAKNKIDEALKKLREAYALNPKSADFETTAKELSLKTGSTGLFKYNSYIEGIGASNNFINALKTVKDDEFTSGIETPAGYYIVKLKSKEGIDEKKFDEQKKDFSEQLLGKKKQETFGKFLEELKKHSQGGPVPTS